MSAERIAELRAALDGYGFEWFGEAEIRWMLDEIERLQNGPRTSEVFNDAVPVRNVRGTLVNVGDYAVKITASDHELGEVFERIVAFPFANKTGRPIVFVDHIGRPL